MIKDTIFPLIILYYFTNKSPIIEDFKKTLGINQRKVLKILFLTLPCSLFTYLLFIFIMFRSCENMKWKLCFYLILSNTLIFACVGEFIEYRQYYDYYYFFHSVIDVSGKKCFCCCCFLFKCIDCQLEEYLIDIFLTQCLHCSINFVPKCHQRKVL